MRLPVYHILENEMKDVIPADIYEENLGIWTMTMDINEIGKRFKAIREKALNA